PLRRALTSISILPTCFIFLHPRPCRHSRLLCQSLLLKRRQREYQCIFVDAFTWGQG
ncbi:unnamed protein product, partial [Nesidiocoris tenuis]